MNRVEDIALWLAREAPHDTLEALFAAFCREIVRSLAPVWRASLGLEVLHPEVSGWLHVWEDQACRCMRPTGLLRQPPCPT
jgi:adenylate cyclase